MTKANRLRSLSSVNEYKEEIDLENKVTWDPILLFSARSCWTSASILSLALSSSALVASSLAALMISGSWISSWENKRAAYAIWMAVSWFFLFFFRRH